MAEHRKPERPGRIATAFLVIGVMAFALTGGFQWLRGEHPFPSLFSVEAPENLPVPPRG